MRQQGSKGRGGKSGNRDNKSRDSKSRDQSRGPRQDARGSNRRDERRDERRDDRRDERRPARPHGEQRHNEHRRGGSAPEQGTPRGRATIWGHHAVRAAWTNPARRINAFYISEDNAAQAQEMSDEAAAQGLSRPRPTIIERRALERMTPPGAVHQGIALDAGPLDEVFLQDIINGVEGRDRAVIVMLDQVTDPHNVGAIMRSASAFGAAGIVMQRRHAPELDGTLLKSASGAGEYMPVAYETNLSRALEQLQEQGYTALALDERGDISLEELPPQDKVVMVMGAEGPGIRRLVKEHCDRLVRLPTGGPVGVLNVSNAAAVTLYALMTAKK